MRYNKIKEEFKDVYYDTLRADFLKILDDPVEYNDLISTVKYSNKKIFEQVIISENHDEFDLLRSAYSEEMDNQNEKREYFNNLLNEDFKNLERIDSDYKNAYFNKIKSNFTDILMNKKSFGKIYQFLYRNNKKRFERVIISDSYDEFNALNQKDKIQNDVNRLNSQIRNKQKQYNKAKAEADELLSSNSWKLTKILRRN